jgi:DNA-directed RNA polymerase subunit RPC12/RpoP
MSTLRCGECGAPYKGSISPYQKFVKCPYCGAVIKVESNEQPGKVKKVRLIEEMVIQENKTFDINEFALFLNKIGVKTFDPVSGILQMGTMEVRVTGEGAVEGTEPLKSRVEKWIQKYMSER